jgi:hypothetical protein
VSDLFQLVTKKPPEPHFLGPAKSVLLAEGNENVERECVKCGLVRITFIPRKGHGGRFYRWGDAPGQFYDAIEPECGGVVVEQAKREVAQC